MAPVNPELKVKATPEFVNDSKGAPGFKSDNTLGSLFQGMGELVSGAVKVTDDYFKKTIEQEATANVDAIRDAQLGYRKPPMGAAESGAPDEVVRQGERLKNLTTAYQSGRVNESHYWMLLDVEARKLRNKYPGYRDYIDSTISGLVGTNPANALVRSLRSEAAAGSGRKDDSLKNLRELEEEASRAGLKSHIDSYYQSNPTADTDQKRNFILSVVSREAAIRKGREAEEAELKLAKSRGEAVEAKAEKIATSVIDNVRTQNQTIMFRGANLSPSQLMETLRKNPGAELSPEETAMLNQELTLLKSQTVANINAEFDRRDEKGWSLGQMVSPQKRSQMIEAVAKDYDTLMEDIRTKNYTYAAANQMLFEARRNDDFRKVYDSSPVFPLINGMRQAGGEVAVSQYLMGSKGREGLAGAVDMASKALIAGKGESLQSVTDKAREAGVKDPKFYSGLVDDTIRALADPNMPLDLKVKKVESLYGKNNEGFIARLTDAQGRPSQEVQLQYFNKMVSPEVERALYDISARSGRKDLWEKYAVWSVNTASALFRSDLNTLQNTVEYRKNITVDFDNKTLQFRIQPRLGSEREVGFQANRGFIARQTESWQESEAEKAMGRINTVMQRMGPIIQRSEDVPRETAKLLQRFGIDLMATYDPRGTAFDQLALSAQSFFSQGSENAKKSGADKLGGSVIDGVRNFLMQGYNKEQGRVGDEEPRKQMPGRIGNLGGPGSSNDTGRPFAPTREMLGALNPEERAQLDAIYRKWYPNAKPPSRDVADSSRGQASTEQTFEDWDKRGGPGLWVNDGATDPDRWARSTNTMNTRDFVERNGRPYDPYSKEDVEDIKNQYLKDIMPLGGGEHTNEHNRKYANNIKKLLSDKYEPGSLSPDDFGPDEGLDAILMYMYIQDPSELNARRIWDRTKKKKPNSVRDGS